MRIAIIAVSAIALTGCTGMGRLMSYGTDQAHAQVHVGRAGYNIWVHPSDDTIIVQERFGGAMGGALVEGFTLGAAETSPHLPIPRHAGALFLARFECSVEDAYELEGITTEIAFSCPEGVRPSEVDARICADTPINPLDYRDPGGLVESDCK